MTVYSTLSANSDCKAELFSERLCAATATAPEVVLLAGWSLSRECWRGVLGPLLDRAHVTLIDLPGHGQSPESDWSPTSLPEQILAVAPERALYIGWSLGGSLALQLANVAPQRVQGVITLGTNPCFVARADWPCGLSQDDFDSFRVLVEQRGHRALTRFDALQCGLSASRSVLQWCRVARGPAPAAGSLGAGLELLGQLDLRPILHTVAVPVTHLLGGDDPLVPAAVAPQLRQLAPHHRVLVLEQVGHLLPLQARTHVLDAVDHMLGEQTLALSQRDKRAVAESFSAAAETYDSVADLQRTVGAALLDRLPAAASVTTVLDLGAGTGYFRKPLTERTAASSYVGLDLAQGMVQFARDQAACDTAAWLAGDAEALPLAGSSIDSVFSSLAIQWSERLPLLFSEIERVLKPGGCFVFSTLAPGTLAELEAAWSRVDSCQHVNSFAPVEDVAYALQGSGLTQGSIESERIVLRYEKVVDLLRDLKGIGAHNLNAGRPRGMTGRKRLLQMIDAYEAARSGGALPATYQVVYGVGYKRNG